MRSLAVWVGVWAVLAASCRRPLGGKEDAGDTGVPINLDGGPVDVPAADIPAADVSPGDVAAEAPRPDAGGDVGRDAAVDLIPGAVCPANVAPVNVCGCGCCGEAMGRACYYPALGESRETVPNPIPPPQNCAAAGCSFGVRHLCCADPGAQIGVVTLCAYNTSDEDYPRFQVTKRDGAVCTTLEIALSAFGAPILGPGLTDRASAWRGPCDGTTTQNAIGGLGSVTPSPLTHADGNSRRDIHVALFFDSGTGIAEAVRIDADDVATGPNCQKSACPVCGGTCMFDATYQYGRLGGKTAVRHTVLLEPPASFTHVRSSTAISPPPPDQSCAPALPLCGGAAMDAGDVMAALADRDVQDVFERSKGAATIPIYGVDPRPVDGQVFRIARSSGGGFLVGGPCPPNVPTSSCMPIPGGVSRLVSVLTALDEQQLADPACAALPR
jgi:hypothetical protein